MSEPFDPEDLAAFGVLDDLAHSGPEDTAPIPPLTPLPPIAPAPPSLQVGPLPPGGALPPPAEATTDEAVEVLRRLYLESLGLLAYELEPAAPRPETRAAVLAHLIGDETQEVSPLVIGDFAPALLAPLAPLAPVPPTLSRPPAGAAAEPSRAPIFNPATGGLVAGRASDAPAAAGWETMAGRSRPRRRWAIVLAALFALAAVGLSVWVAILQSEVAYRDSRIQGLESRLTGADHLARELDEAKTELAEVEQRYTFVTAPAMTVFALRPPAGTLLQPTARGHLFLAADHQHWQLEVRGLKPEPEPQDYQLWFIVDGLPLSGGVFDVKLGKPALLAAASMPAGTTAVAITLERKGGTTSPTSPILLFADSSVQI